VLDSGVGRSAAAGLVAGNPGRAAGGFGLTGVRERLATLYGARASLSLQDAPGGGTLACVRLPILTLPMPATPTPPATSTSTSTPSANPPTPRST
jgi:hypothetical protein